MTSVFSIYLGLNFLLLAGLLVLFVFSKLGLQINSRQGLKLNYFVFSAAVLFSLVIPLMPSNHTFQPIARVWAATSVKKFSEQYRRNHQGFLSVPAINPDQVVETRQVSIWFTALLATAALLAISLLIRDWRNLIQIRRNSYLVRRVGRTFIHINDSISVPFSYWIPGQANVVIPTHLVGTREFKIAVLHELQHHRQKDTKWVYAFWLLKFLCVLNPAIHLWNKWTTEIQEFACDETLLGRKKVLSRDYASCLLQVAQTALHQENIPACASGLVFLVKGTLLKRRIESMKKGRTVNRAWTHVLAGAILFFSLGGAAYASKNWVQDRRVTSAQAQKMADDAMAKSKSKHPLHITVTSRVVKQLNRFIGTPEGREYMRNALQRMENYRAMMEPILDNPDAPRELMAIPIIESGYENLPERSGSVKSAGLWQFIPRTAEVFGLRVNGQVDERLDEKKATKAAIRYLKSNYWRFDSWKLSIIAYNAGEAAVQKAIDATGSREPWTLIDAGVENDTDYFAKVMAAMIIMGNPESVQE